MIQSTTEIRLGGCYILGRKIGKGAFGEIYEGFDTQTKKKVAIKLETQRSSYNQLKNEAHILKEIQSEEAGIPAMYWFGMEGDYKVMVMQLFWENLERIFQNQKKKMKSEIIYMIMAQALKIIKYVHSKRYIHRDIKPENFMMPSKTANKLFLIDFGIAKRYMDEKKVHIPYKTTGGLVGTARYASCNSHNGIELSRRDDIESAFYMALYFFNSSLPWQSIPAATKKEKYKKIADIKLSISAEKLTEKLPKKMCELLVYIKKLKFEEEPNYEKIMNLLGDAAGTKPTFSSAFVLLCSNKIQGGARRKPILVYTNPGYHRWEGQISVQPVKDD